MTRKGITPVVAVVLLISVTIGATATVYTTVQSLTPSEEEIESQTSFDGGEIKLRTSIENNRIYLTAENTGDTTINTSEIRMRYGESEEEAIDRSQYANLRPEKFIPTGKADQHYRLIDGSGNTVENEVTNNDATITGGDWRDCGYGTCLWFDGDTLLEFDNPITTDEQGGTISFRFNSNTTDSQGIFSRDLGSLDSHIELRQNELFGEVDSNCNYFNNDNFRKTDEEMRYTLVFDGGAAHHYVNGYPIGETENYGPGCSGNSFDGNALYDDLTLNYAGGGTGYVPDFTGYIYSIKFYNQALEPGEATRVQGNCFDHGATQMLSPDETYYCATDLKVPDQGESITLVADAIGSNEEWSIECNPVNQKSQTC